MKKEMWFPSYLAAKRIKTSNSDLTIFPGGFPTVQNSRIPADTFAELPCGQHDIGMPFFYFQAMKMMPNVCGDADT
jgi:hypothetical protein